MRQEDIHLPLSWPLAPRTSAPATTADPCSGEPQERLRSALQGLFQLQHEHLYDWIEETVIRAAYDYCHRNQVQAARMLGVSRNVMRSRLIKIGAISALK